MSELELQKHTVVTQLRRLCAHCASDVQRSHNCPVQEITARVQAIKGIPLIVNDRFEGALWAHI